MFTATLARVELDRFWVNPGDRIFAMLSFASSGPSVVPLELALRLRPANCGPDTEWTVAPCLATTRWPDEVWVREGLLPLTVPEGAEPGRYALLVGLVDPLTGAFAELGNPAEQKDGCFCCACGIDVMPPRWVGRREPITLDLTDRPGGCSDPVSVVTLHSSEVDVSLDSTRALPLNMRFPSGESISGEPARSAILAAVSRIHPRAGVALEVRPFDIRAWADRAEFLFCITCFDSRAATFSLAYRLEGRTLSASVEDVHEYDGFELISVELPGLASVSGSDPDAWIAYAEDGGQLAALADTRGGRLRATTEWRFSAPVAMIGSGSVSAVLEVPSYCDTTELTVNEIAGLKTAWLGTTKWLRTPGGRATANLPIEQPSLCRLHLLEAPDGRKVTWLDAAKRLRKSMPPLPSRYYDERAVYKIFCQCGGGGVDTTFEQAGEIIRGFARLTDSWPQSVYLVGWQYHGHDTGYPAVDVVNEAVGGEEGLRLLMTAASSVNCTVSFHDNYDDAYRDSPDWDERFIARNPDGELMMGGYWAGGQTWIIGMSNYAQSVGWDRAVRTCTRYCIRDTYHIDVLSAEALRSDWNPERPASAYSNLMGKHRIIDAFASQGVDVTTEGISWPFVGKASWFFSFQHGICDRFGGEAPVPMVQALYRQSARWGGTAGGGEAALLSLLKGCSFGLEVKAGPRAVEQLADSFYIIHVPWMRLRDRPLESYECRHGVEVLGYGSGTFIRLDWNTATYTIAVDGVEVARDFATFCPLGEDRLAFYSPDARELIAALPENWDPDRLSARALFPDEQPSAAHFCCDGATVCVRVAPRTPVVVVRQVDSI